MEFVNHHRCSECFFFASEAASKQCQNSLLLFQRRLRAPPNPILLGFGFPAQNRCTPPLAYGSWAAQAVGWHLRPELRFAARCHTRDLLSLLLLLLGWAEPPHQWANAAIFMATAPFLKKRSLGLFGLALKVFHKKQDT